jgi:hypothetical protein
LEQVQSHCYCRYSGSQQSLHINPPKSLVVLPGLQL